MKALARLAVPALAACGTVVVTASLATAATTTIHKDTATGAPYSGNYQGTNIGSFTIAGTIAGSTITSTCDHFVIGGAATPMAPAAPSRTSRSSTAAIRRTPPAPTTRAGPFSSRPRTCPTPAA